MAKILNRAFFLEDAQIVAKKLLGKVLVRQIDDHNIIKMRIIETEAYMGVNDQACHSYGFKKTPRVLPMYDIGGTTYVYLIYGMYFCFNIVVNLRDNPQAVLIRAGEIISGTESAKQNLAFTNKKQPFSKWTNGPGKLCIALKINKSLNQQDLLTCEQLFLEDDSFLVKAEDIVSTVRININYAGKDKDLPYRFYLKNSPFISKS